MEPGLKSPEDQPMAERWTTWPEDKWERAQSAGKSIVPDAVGICRPKG